MVYVKTWKLKKKKGSAALINIRQILKIKA